MGSRCTSKYQAVPQRTQKNIKVPRSISKYQEIPQSTQKYHKVPRSTSKYPEVPKGTQWYLKVPQVLNSLEQFRAVWDSLEQFGTQSCKRDWMGWDWLSLNSLPIRVTAERC